MMNRIRLMISSTDRRRLKSLARRTARTELEMARVLLLDALERAEREEFYAGVKAAHTEEIRQRQIRMIEAFSAYAR